MFKHTVSLTTTSLAAALMLAAGTAAGAAARDYPANTAPSAGIPSNEAVNPAPDASGKPYIGAGVQHFYDPMDRERAMQRRLDAAAASGALSPRQVRQAQSALAGVIAEERTQTARHGGLRDWDRERLNDMMNHIVEQYAVLRG